MLIRRSFWQEWHLTLVEQRNRKAIIFILNGFLRVSCHWSGAWLGSRHLDDIQVIQPITPNKKTTIRSCFFPTSKRSQNKSLSKLFHEDMSISIHSLLLLLLIPFGNRWTICRVIDHSFMISRNLASRPIIFFFLRASWPPVSEQHIWSGSYGGVQLMWFFPSGLSCKCVFFW